MDHHELRWVLNMADETGKLERRLLRLSKFDIAVVHQDGVKPQAGDVSIRLSTTGMEKFLARTMYRY